MHKENSWVSHYEKCWIWESGMQAQLSVKKLPGMST
jgi:hypothetical protein